MSDKTFVIKFATETDTDELAGAVRDAIGNHDDLIGFVLRLDELVADWDFTKALADRLAGVVAEEGEKA